MAGARPEKEKDRFMKGEARESKFMRQPSREGALHNHETICISQCSLCATDSMPDGLKLGINNSQNGYLAIRKQVINFAS